MTLNLPSDATPEQIAKAARVGEMYLLPRRHPGDGQRHDSGSVYAAGEEYAARDAAVAYRGSHGLGLRSR